MSVGQKLSSIKVILLLFHLIAIVSSRTLIRLFANDLVKFDRNLSLNRFFNPKGDSVNQRRYQQSSSTKNQRNRSNQISQAETFTCQKLGEAFNPTIQWCSNN